MHDARSLRAHIKAQADRYGKGRSEERSLTAFGQHDADAHQLTAALKIQSAFRGFRLRTCIKEWKRPSILKQNYAASRSYVLCHAVAPALTAYFKYIAVPTDNLPRVSQMSLKVAHAGLAAFLRSPEPALELRQAVWQTLRNCKMWIHKHHRLQKDLTNPRVVSHALQTQLADRIAAVLEDEHFQTSAQLSRSSTAQQKRRAQVVSAAVLRLGPHLIRVRHEDEAKAVEAVSVRVWAWSARAPHARRTRMSVLSACAHTTGACV